MIARRPLRGCFVTGTDTEVGKTSVSAALLHWFGRTGWRTAGFKPVAAGTTLIDGTRVNEDVRILRDASSTRLTDAQVGPCQLHTACAPHIAASIEGVAIDRQRLMQAALALAAHADFLVAEGVGGFCVPLGPDWDSADLASDLGLPVVLVIGLRLGCLNHALLTAETIRARGLPIAGWVASSIDPSMAHAADNVATLHHELGRRWKAPCLGVVPTLESPHAAAVAACLNDAALRSAFERQWPLSNPFSLRTA